MTFAPPDVPLAPLLPILIALLGAVAATVLGFFLPRRAVTWIGIVALLLSAFSMGTLWNSGASAFAGSLRADNVGLAFGMVIIVGALISLLVSLDGAARASLSFPEFDAMLLYAVTGCLILAMSGDLITLLIGLEVMSLSGYVLATLQARNAAEEAGLKYFLLGAVGSAILIYGIALTFGATGSLSFAGIAAAISAPGFANGVLLGAGALLMLCGFGFKVALVPFHQWTPDVYSGAPTIVSIFLSTVVKVAAFAGMLRVFSGALYTAPAWPIIMQLLVIATLVVGNLASLVQRNFKRLLAYSAVAHTGFLGLTLLADPRAGGPALVYYLLIYTLMTAAAFAVVALIQPDERGVEVSDLRGLYYRSPALAAVLAVCLASLAGLPPFAGFMGKYLAFQAAFQHGFVVTTVIAALSSVVAFVYYLYPAALLFIPDRTPAPLPHTARRFTGPVLAVAVVGITALGVLPNLAYAWLANPADWQIQASK